MARFSKSDQILYKQLFSCITYVLDGRYVYRDEANFPRLYRKFSIFLDVPPLPDFGGGGGRWGGDIPSIFVHIFSTIIMINFEEEDQVDIIMEEGV